MIGPSIALIPQIGIHRHDDKKIACFRLRDPLLVKMSNVSNSLCFAVLPPAPLFLPIREGGPPTAPPAARAAEVL